MLLPAHNTPAEFARLSSDSLTHTCCTLDGTLDETHVLHTRTDAHAHARTHALTHSCARQYAVQCDHRGRIFKIQTIHDQLSAGNGCHNTVCPLCTLAPTVCSEMSEEKKCVCMRAKGETPAGTWTKHGLDPTAAAEQAPKT